jgi:hypothetical protein
VFTVGVQDFHILVAAKLYAVLTALGVAAKVVDVELVLELSCTTHFADVVPFATLINQFDTHIFDPILTIHVTVVDANGTDVK